MRASCINRCPYKLKQRRLMSRETAPLPGTLLPILEGKREVMNGGIR
jgi:hypothetical protein